MALLGWLASLSNPIDPPDQAIPYMPTTIDLHHRRDDSKETATAMTTAIVISIS
jgi:hypothetical protein